MYVANEYGDVANDYRIFLLLFFAIFVVERLTPNSFQAEAFGGNPN